MDRVKEIIGDKGIGIVVYGSGPQSLDALVAAGKLTQEGYQGIRVLAGGLKAWQNAGLPLEGTGAEESSGTEDLRGFENGIYILETE